MTRTAVYTTEEGLECPTCGYAKPWGAPCPTCGRLPGPAEDKALAMKRRWRAAAKEKP